MNAEVIAEMCAAGIVAEDQRGCAAAFHRNFQTWKAQGTCDDSNREILHAIFTLGWIERSMWRGELNPVADQTPGGAQC